MSSHDDLMASIAKFHKDIADAAERVRKKGKAAKAPSSFVKNAFRRPQHSDALAVNPRQVEAARKFCKDRGVPTDYTPRGSPIITSPAHQKAHAKIRGFFPKRG